MKNNIEIIFKNVYLPDFEQARFPQPANSMIIPDGMKVIFVTFNQLRNYHEDMKAHYLTLPYGSIKDTFYSISEIIHQHVIKIEKVETAAVQYAVHLVNIINNDKYSASDGKKEYARKLMESIPSSSDFKGLEKHIRAALNDLGILIFDEKSKLPEYIKSNTYDFEQIKACILKEISNRAVYI